MMDWESNNYGMKQILLKKKRKVSEGSFVFIQMFLKSNLPFQLTQILILQDRLNQYFNISSLQ